MKAKRLAPRPDEAAFSDREKAKARWPKYMPRAPKAAEHFLRVERPHQKNSPTVYQAGDYFAVWIKLIVPAELQSDTPREIVADWYEDHGKPTTAAFLRGVNVVVVAAGKALTVALGNGFGNQMLQYLVVRIADDKDDEAIAPQKEAEKEKARKIQDWAANS